MKRKKGSSCDIGKGKGEREREGGRDICSSSRVKEKERNKENGDRQTVIPE